jgi:hypothetical protein
MEAQLKNLVLTLGKQNKVVLLLPNGERVEIATCKNETKKFRLSIRATESVKIRREAKANGE